MNLPKMDYELILSDNVFINEKYKNKTLSTMASDTDDDGTISYVMNEQGYRSNSFIDKSDYNVLTLGCSWTMGIGVNNEDIWASIVTNKIQEQLNDRKVKLFNYGIYGVSTSFTAKNFYKILETEIIPDLVLIMWPGFSRRDYIKSDGSFKKVGGFRLAHERDVIWKNEDEDINFIELRNDYQDLMEFWESYKFVETTAKLKNVKVIHTVAGYYYQIFKTLKPHLENTIDYNNFYEPTDCHKTDFAARDKHHPGSSWHKDFSNKFYNFLKDKI
jgi:hypothetical protein